MALALLLLLKKSLLLAPMRGGGRLPSSSSSTTISPGCCFIQSRDSSSSSCSRVRVRRRRPTEEEERAMFEEWVIRSGKQYGCDDEKEARFEFHFRENLRKAGYNLNRLDTEADLGLREMFPRMHNWKQFPKMRERRGSGR